MKQKLEFVIVQDAHMPHENAMPCSEVEDLHDFRKGPEEILLMFMFLLARHVRMPVSSWIEGACTDGLAKLLTERRSRFRYLPQFRNWIVPDLCHSRRNTTIGTSDVHIFQLESLKCRPAGVSPWLGGSPNHGLCLGRILWNCACFFYDVVLNN